MFNQISDKLLKQFLLGMPPERKHLRIESRLFSDPSFFARLLEMEDELIDDYYYDRLNDEEKRCFEKNFLSSPERIKKYELARNLNANLEEWAAPPKEQKATRQSEMPEPAKQKKLQALSHNALIIYLGAHHGDNYAWHEFMNRFQKFLASVIEKECERLKYQNGLSNLNELLQKVYLRLLQNNSLALKNFKGNHPNSLISYLKLVALNVVRSDWKMQNTSQPAPALQQYEANLIYAIQDLGVQSDVNYQDLTEAIDAALSSIANKRRNGKRDVLIFKYSLFRELQAYEITQMPEFQNLSSKRLANIVAEIKEELRQILVQQNMIDKF